MAVTIPTYFNPRSPSGLRRNCGTPCSGQSAFQSTQPEWAATAKLDTSTPEPIFQSTQPEWAATAGCAGYDRLCKFQSTQPEWAATTNELQEYLETGISIHAARVGCDVAFYD